VSPPVRFAGVPAYQDWRETCDTSRPLRSWSSSTRPAPRSFSRWLTCD